jgi:general secretion pathway protein D
MKIEIKSLSGSSINEIPIIANRSFEQTVRLKEDETTVMAGVLQDNESLGINGTPGLAYLPKLGYLFGTRSVNDQGTELLVLITPRLVRRVPHVDRIIYAGHDSGASGPVGLPFGRPAQFPLPPPQTEPRVQQ